MLFSRLLDISKKLIPFKTAQEFLTTDIDKVYRRWLIIITLLELVSGIVVLEFTERLTEQKMQSYLLLHVKTVAATLDAEDLEKLTGTSSDIEKSDYARLRQKLKHARLYDPRCRVFYVARCIDNKVTVLADSEEEDSVDYSPPGSELTVVSTRIDDLFKSGDAFI